MKTRFASWGLFCASLLLSACTALPPATEEPDSLAGEVCDVTRQRLASAQPETPATQALATRIDTNCEQLGRAYAEALRDAALAGEASPAPPLRSPQDPDDIVRRGERIRAVLWTNGNTVERFYSGETGSTPSGKPVVWVSLAPELRQWCSSLDWSPSTPERLAAGYQRISQRLGLPPYSLNNRVVALWVKPDRLLRPCADPGTEEDSCSSDFPASIDVPDLNREAYAAWFADNVGYAYSAGGAPWTRYGWTYDWADDTEDAPYGITEFMLAPDTDYEIAGRYKAEDYCTM